MKRSSALILGGGIWQLDIIRSASQLGLRTVVVDISTDAPGREIADRFTQVDTSDRGALEAIVSAEKIDLILAEQSDRVVPVAAHLNAHFDLPGIRPEIASVFTNKLAMREALAHKSVTAMPFFREVGQVGEAIDFAGEFGFPVILKPKASQSSLGVYRARSRSELSDCFPHAMAQANDGRILIEEFVDGPEITVEAISIEGRCHVLAISEKEHYSANPCVAKRLAYQPRWSLRQFGRVRTIASTVVESLGLEDGISHAEYRMRGDDPYLIEVAARGGGNRIASLIAPHVSGVDLYSMLIKRLLGATVTVPPALNRSGILEFFDFPQGRIGAFHGFEQARTECRPTELVMNISVGSEVEPPGDDRTRPGYFIVLGDNREDTDARASRIRALVRADYA